MTDDHNHSDDRHLAESFLEMLNTHDVGLLDHFIGETYVNHNEYVADGREANSEFWTGFFAAFPDVSGRMDDLVVSGDRVVGRFTYRGTHTGDFMGIPATGLPIEMRTIDIWRVEDGKFVEHWDEINALQLFQQIGVLPHLGETGAAK